MCRTGGRRCQGSSGRATQNTRQQRSRAKRALRKAQASGDADAIREATERLNAANVAHQAAKENAMPRDDKHDEIGGQGGDVTPDQSTVNTSGSGITNIAAPGSFVAVQGRIITGDVRVNGRRVKADTAVQQGDVTAPGATQQEQDANVHTGRSGDFHVTNVAYGNVGVQAGVIRGGVIVNGRVVNPGQTGSSSAGLSREEVQRAQDNARRTVEQAHRQAAHAREQARRIRDAARQGGDVTATQSTFRTASGGTVTNVVYGQNHGIQTDTVNGPLHFGPGGITFGTPDDDDQ